MGEIFLKIEFEKLPAQDANFQSWVQAVLQTLYQGSETFKTGELNIIFKDSTNKFQLSKKANVQLSEKVKELSEEEKSKQKNEEIQEAPFQQEGQELKVV